MRDEEVRQLAGWQNPKFPTNLGKVPNLLVTARDETWKFALSNVVGTGTTCQTGFCAGRHSLPHSLTHLLPAQCSRPCSRRAASLPSDRTFSPCNCRWRTCTARPGRGQSTSSSTSSKPTCPWRRGIRSVSCSLAYPSSLQSSASALCLGNFSRLSVFSIRAPEKIGSGQEGL